MDKFINLFCNVIEAVGGPGVIIIALSALLSKFWIDLFMNKKALEHSKMIEQFKSELTTKQEEIKANFTTKLEVVKGRVSEKNYMSKVRFDAEFETYRNLNMVFSVMLRDLKMISPPFFQDSKDNKTLQHVQDEKLFEIAESAFQAAQNQLFQNAAFIDKEKCK